MEKKTIGQFIAALRKASGMTQKELAEKLNVSDKAVSRWERDESAPDLSLIPVIAEIFGVTSDEILRGERAGARETTTERNSEKGRKQIANLLNKSKTKFQMYSLASIGIASAGLFAAMVFNFGFLKAHVGFFVACAFFAAAIIAEAVFYISAKSAVNIEDVEEELLVGTQGYIVKWLMGTLLGIIAMFAFCLPLFIFVDDAYWGLTADSWFFTGLVLAGIVGIAGLLVIWILSSGINGQNPFAATEKEIKRNQLKLHYVKVTAIALAITGVVHIVFCGMAAENNFFAKGTTFDNYDDFVKFMETPMSYYEHWNEGEMDDVVIMESQVTMPGDSIDDIGNEDSYITDEDLQEENVHKEQLCDKDGNVLCEYVERNQSISMIDYGKAKDGYLPITVYTNRDLDFALHIMNDVVNPICALIYVVEIAIGVHLYFKKRQLV